MPQGLALPVLLLLVWVGPDALALPEGEYQKASKRDEYPQSDQPVRDASSRLSRFIDICRGNLSKTAISHSCRLANHKFDFRLFLVTKFYNSASSGAHSRLGTGEVGVLGAISCLNFSGGSGMISRERRPSNMV